MIAVIGATGNTGRAVVKELQALGQSPLCIIRDVEKAKSVLGPNAKTVVADIADKAAIEKALQGVTSVFLVTGHNPQMAEQQTNILEAAKKAGVEYIVRVSGGAAVVGPDVESVVGRGHHAIEQTMAKSGVKWVNLRPGLFMQNTLAQAALIKNDSKMVLPYAKDLPIAFTDVRDTGAVGARILIDPARHAGKTYAFTGKLSNFGEFADVFSQVLGKKITYIEATLEQAAAALKGRGLPDWLVTHLISIAKAAANGAFSKENTGPIVEIAKRQPITTRQFVEDFKGAFA
jgi:uncharacterized protein YbjT (DUF2867 family)